MLKHPDRSASTSSITVNFPLLYAVLAVFLVVIAEFILALSPYPLSIGGIIISFLALLTLFLSLVYAVYELFTTMSLALRNYNAATGVCVSTFLGGFLLGAVAFALAIITTQDFLLTGIAIIISIFSLTGLWFFLSSDISVMPVEQSFEQRRDVYLRLPELPLQAESTATYQGIVVMRSRPQVRREDLPPLFQNDILYRAPQPHDALFFEVVKEGEDACVISRDETRFALCDGAGGSSLPRPWASLLGQQWIREPLGENYRTRLLSWLEEPRQRWAQWVQETWWLAVNGRNQLTGDHLVGQEEVAGILERGASATLLGVEVNRQHHRWSVLALGDTCLFVIRPSSSWQMVTSIPMKNSQDFNLTPPLLSSQRGASVNELLPYVRYRSDFYQKGDLLLMATDALAQWVLQQREQGGTAWRELLHMNDQKSFVHYIEQQRREGLMEEDDTTLVVIRL